MAEKNEEKMVVEQNFPALIDHKVYGIDVSRANDILGAFTEFAVKHSDLVNEYESIVANKEITPELSKKAREIRLKLMKVRTGSDKVGKAEKEVYTKVSKFIDAVRSKFKDSSEIMESKLAEIENHAKIEEEKRISKLEEERHAEISKYINIPKDGLGMMIDAAYKALLDGAIASAKQREEAEAEKKIAETIKERVEALGKYGDLVSDEHLISEFLVALSQEQFGSLCAGYDNMYEKAKEEKEKAAKEDKKQNEWNLKNVSRCSELMRLEMFFNPDEKHWESRYGSILDGSFTDPNKISDEEFETSLKLIKAAYEGYRPTVEYKVTKVENKHPEWTPAPEESEAPEKSRKELAYDWINRLAIQQPPLDLVDEKVIKDILTKFDNFKKWGAQQIEKEII